MGENLWYVHRTEHYPAITKLLTYPTRNEPQKYYVEQKCARCELPLIWNSRSGDSQLPSEIRQWLSNKEMGID